VTIRFSRTLLH